MDSRWAIIVLVTVPAQSLFDSCHVGIYPYFNEWWLALSMKVTYCGGVLLPISVLSVAKVIFHLDNLHADIRH